MSCYKGNCPICGKAVIKYSEEHSDSSIGSIYQGKIKRYFHLDCLDSIKRGSNNGKA